MLNGELDAFSKDWLSNKLTNGSFRLPYNITFCAKEIDIKVVEDKRTISFSILFEIFK